MSRDLRLRLFTAGAFALALGASVVSFKLQPVPRSPVLLALVVVAILSELLAVEFSSLTVSITVAVMGAAIILYGPFAGALVTGIASIPPALTVKERPWLRGLFNFSQLTLTALAGGWAYVWTGGRLLASLPLTGGEPAAGILIPVGGLAIACFLVNTSLVGMFVSISSGVPFFSMWRSTFVWTIPTHAALTILALALAQVVASEEIVGLGLFVIPLLIARQFYARYALLRRTYASTVRSLVAVIEAKDAYTRGHSERVATYSIDIARRLGFSDERVERVELAALLHDLGKVGISRAILSKNSRLSDDEYEVIKTHPDIGAHIIEEVPFLADLVPFISGHHERFDGTGYGNRLEGEAIPLEARVLGVADAFDAMTSSRPYRAPMSVEQTVRELRRCSDRQFDRVVVETFVEALDTGAYADVLPEAVTDEAI